VAVHVPRGLQQADVVEAEGEREAAVGARVEEEGARVVAYRKVPGKV